MIGVMHFTKCSRTSTIASARIATFIERTIRQTGSGEPVELIHEAASAHHAADKHSILFVVNSPFGFCDWRDRAIEIAGNATSIIWVQNDYAIKPPSQFKKFNIKIDEWWTTCMDVADGEDGRYIDWNMLTYMKYAINGDGAHVIPGLLYFGAYRQGRQSSFEEYLNTVLYQVRVSTTRKNIEKFMQMNSHKTIKYYEPFQTLGQVMRFQTSIYIEDDGSHGQHHSLANRFYEMLSAGVAICIDEKASNIFRLYDLPQWEDFVVCNEHEVRKVVEKNYKEWSTRQAKLWRRDYISELSENLILALEEVI